MQFQKSIVGNLGIDCVEYDGNIDFFKYDYIIDAIFGIGLSRAVEGRYAQVMKQLIKPGESRYEDNCR
ncbi:MAG: NAD(P)H-hydrate epimerase [Lachnospira eligens]